MTSIGSNLVTGAGRPALADAEEIARKLGFLEPLEREVAGWMTVARVPAGDYVTWTAAFDDLSRRAVQANPFMSPAAVAAARTIYADDQIVVLAARKPTDAGEKLMAVWCFVATRDVWTGGARILQTPLAPRYDALAHPVLDKADMRTAMAVLIGQIERDKALPGVIRAGSFPVSLCSEVPRHARLSLAERWQRALLQPAEALDAEGYLARAMGSSYRKRQSQWRALARLGQLDHVTLRGGDAIAAFEAFIELEARGWKGAAGTALSRLPADAAYMRAFVAALGQADQVAIDMLRLDGRPVAIGLLPEQAGAALFWKTAFDETLARHSPGVLLDMAVTRRLFAEGRPLLDSGMMEFTDPDSQPWSERLALARLVIDVRHGFAGTAAMGGQRLRHGLRRLQRKWRKA